MENIRRARCEDLARIAEIEVFNYRLNFYPIFQNDRYYFEELQVPKVLERYKNAVDNILVYDESGVKGFVQVDGQEILKLFVEPVLQGQSIGGKLLDYVIREMDARYLWALEKNGKAISFYKSHGFYVTENKRFEEGTDEYLVRLERKI